MTIFVILNLPYLKNFRFIFSNTFWSSLRLCYPSFNLCLLPSNDLFPIFFFTFTLLLPIFQSFYL